MAVRRRRPLIPPPHPRRNRYIPMVRPHAGGSSHLESYDVGSGLPQGVGGGAERLDDNSLRTGRSVEDKCFHGAVGFLPALTSYALFRLAFATAAHLKCLTLPDTFNRRTLLQKVPDHPLTGSRCL